MSPPDAFDQLANTIRDIFSYFIIKKEQTASLYSKIKNIEKSYSTKITSPIVKIINSQAALRYSFCREKMNPKRNINSFNGITEVYAKETAEKINNFNITGINVDFFPIRTLHQKMIEDGSVLDDKYKSGDRTRAYCSRQGLLWFSNDMNEFFFFTDQFGHEIRHRFDINKTFDPIYSLTLARNFVSNERVLNILKRQKRQEDITRADFDESKEIYTNWVAQNIIKETRAINNSVKWFDEYNKKFLRWERNYFDIYRDRSFGLQSFAYFAVKNYYLPNDQRLKAMPEKVYQEVRKLSEYCDTSKK